MQISGARLYFKLWRKLVEHRKNMGRAFFFSFTHLAYATLINQKKKSEMYKWKKNVDTGLTSISYFYVQLYKFKKAILYVYTKVVYTQVCTEGLYIYFLRTLRCHLLVKTPTLHSHILPKTAYFQD